MNSKHHEYEALTGPMIFTVPVYGFVMALHLNRLGHSNLASSQCQNERLILSGDWPRTAHPLAGRGLDEAAERRVIGKR